MSIHVIIKCEICGDTGHLSEPIDSDVKLADMETIQDQLVSGDRWHKVYDKYVCSLRCQGDAIIQTPRSQKDELFDRSVRLQEAEEHDWIPAFFGCEYQTYRCKKCESVKRVKGDEIGYCQGPQTLFTKWDEPFPVCIVHQ